MPFIPYLRLVGRKRSRKSLSTNKNQNGNQNIRIGENQKRL